MSTTQFCEGRGGRLVRAAAVALPLLLGPLLAAAGAAEETKGPAGKSLAPRGALLRREGPGKAWQLVGEKEDLSGGNLLLGLPGAIVQSANGAVWMGFLSDLDEKSPFPIKETAAVLNADPAVDMAATLNRGRIDFSNRKPAGSATVRVHVRDQSWDVTLAEPKTRVAFELYGRWPRGVRFTRNPKPEDAPVLEMVVLVLRGEAVLKHGATQCTLHAPPGPAMMRWDSVTGWDATPAHLDKLPDWAKQEDLTAEGKVRREALEKFHKSILEKGLDGTLDAFIVSDDAHLRRLAVLAMAALDDLPRLGKALSETKHTDVLDNGILALRHWIGREPGQDLKLYNLLVSQNKFTPVEAETIVQLLHSFGDADLARPETYEVLIDYLDHAKPAIRNLAHWHLIRLAPVGKSIAYKATDPEEQRAQAVKQWKKLIPSGQLPPRARSGDK
jgi:hypothetical protein